MATSESISERPPGHGKVSRQIVEPQANLQTVGRSDKLTLQFAPSRPLLFSAILHTSLARLAFTALCQLPTRPHIRTHHHSTPHSFFKWCSLCSRFEEEKYLPRAPILPVQS